MIRSVLKHISRGSSDKNPYGFRFSSRSRSAMKGIHPDLRKVLDEAMRTTHIDFMVIEGLRTKERQLELFDQGATKTMRSRHLTGHAVDLVPFVDGKVSWHWPMYNQLSPVIFRAAEKVGVPIEWGGKWATFKDGPHWQLPRRLYP